MSKLFITVSSWEERFYLGFKKILCELEDAAITPVVFTFSGCFDELKKRNLDMVASEMSAPLTHVELSYGDMPSVWRSIDLELNSRLKEQEIREVILDITTMPRHVIWMILKVLDDAHVASVRCIYHQPEKYGDWLTKNPFDPKIVYRLGGEMEMGKETHLLVLAGFDHPRIINLINKFEPQKVILGIHSTSDGDGSFCGRAIGKNKVEPYFGVVHDFEYNALANDYGFQEIFDKSSVYLSADANIILGSLGPKPSAVALYQINKMLKNSALAYVPSHDYNEEYSSGIGKQFYCSLDLSEDAD